MRPRIVTSSDEPPAPDSPVQDDAGMLRRNDSWPAPSRVAHTLPSRLSRSRRLTDRVIADEPQRADQQANPGLIRPRCQYSLNTQIRASPRHARKIVANQIDLIYALQLISAEGALAAQKAAPACVVMVMGSHAE